MSNYRYKDMFMTNIIQDFQTEANNILETTHSSITEALWPHILLPRSRYALLWYTYFYNIQLYILIGLKVLQIYKYDMVLQSSLDNIKIKYMVGI